MRGIFGVVCLFCLVSTGHASSEELISWLGNSVEFTSGTEIRYCPDNTCEVFRAGKSGEDQLPDFALLYLVYKSDYIYLSQSKKPMDYAKAVLKNNSVYCENSNSEVSCVLKGMSEALSIEISFGRYDEGNYGELQIDL